MNRHFAELKRKRPDLHGQVVSSYRVRVAQGVGGIPYLWTDTSDDYTETYSACLHELLRYPASGDTSLHVDDDGPDDEWHEQMNVADLCGTNLAWAKLAACRERAENYPGDNEDPPEVRGQRDPWSGGAPGNDCPTCHADCRDCTCEWEADGRTLPDGSLL